MMYTTEQLQSMVESLEAQLVDLYAEKASMPVPPAQAMSAIASLEEQVISLVDEKMALEQEIAAHHQTIEKLKKKSKILGAAIMEAALFDDPEKE